MTRVKRRHLNEEGSVVDWERVHGFRQGSFLLETDKNGLELHHCRINTVRSEAPMGLRKVFRVMILWVSRVPQEHCTTMLAFLDLRLLLQVSFILAGSEGLASRLS